jgi:citrate lyase subunit beta/citryl-CoA lyase
MTAPRCWLFVPGDSQRKIERAPPGESDALIIDWEDAVAPDAKAKARATTLAALASAKPLAERCWIRVNALGSEHFDADIAHLPLAAIAGVVLPKACGIGDIERLGRVLTQREQAAGVTGARSGIVAIVTETAASVLALSEFRRPLPRLKAMMWGGEDLAGDLGVARNRDDAGAYRAPFQLARNLMLLAAAAAQCQAIEAVRVDYTDLDALASEALQARNHGFTAKAAIHPSQVDPIQRVFAPSEAERDWARRVVEALADGGLAVVDGRMVDAPHLRLARRILS